MFDVAVSGLVLNFLPTPEAATTEAVRVVRPGGLVAAYVWDYADGMALLHHFWDAALSLDPTATTHDERHRFPLCHPDALHRLWSRAGLTDVTVTPIDITTRFHDFDDLWSPFLSGQGPAPGYVAALPPDARERVRRALRERVPTEPGGAIGLGARAWAVRGRKAGRHPGSVPAVRKNVTAQVSTTSVRTSTATP